MSLFENNIFFLKNTDNQQQLYIQGLSSKQKFRDKNMSQSRDHQKKRMRMIVFSQKITYQGTKFTNFANMIQNNDNPYSILLTLFCIVDQFSWRHYIYHLEALIKKLTNLIEESHGQFLCELTKTNMTQIAKDTNMMNKNSYILSCFQQKIEKMFYLSDRVLQEHLLILIHSLIAYNPIHRIIDQRQLSIHLLHRHSYEKCISDQCLWLMTRMHVNEGAIAKILRIYHKNSQNSQTILLPILTVLANFVADTENNCAVLQCFKNQIFHKIIQDGLLSKTIQIQRQTVLLCNNLLFKDHNCQTYLLNQTNLVNAIMLLNNQQTLIFKNFIHNLQNQSNQIQGLQKNNFEGCQ